MSLEMRIESNAVPVAPGRDFLIQGPFPLTENEWDQLFAVLNAMKPGLVTDPVPQVAPALNSLESPGGWP